MTAAHAGKLLWCDLETTGLDPNTCRILEVALVVTDDTPALNTLAEWSSVVSFGGPSRIQIDDYVNKMHTANGLCDACAAPDAPNLLAVEDLACKFIGQHCPLIAPVLCGNSIHFDRAFIKRHLPNVENYLHYRMVDVSSLKVLAHRWGFPEFPKPDYPNQAHRAALDIRASIEELKFYRGTMLKDTRTGWEPES